MLPNLSYMMNVGQVRFIQSRYEEAEYRNPDTLAGNFLSSRQLLKSFVRGKFLMQRLRNNPFYHYVLARTKYYDDAFLSAIYSGARCIVNIGPPASE